MIILILSLLIFLPLIVYGIYKLVKPSTPNSPTTTPNTTTPNSPTTKPNSHTTTPYQINAKQTTSSPTTTEPPCTETDPECCKWKHFDCEANDGDYLSQQQWVKGLDINNEMKGCVHYKSE